MVQDLIKLYLSISLCISVILALIIMYPFLLIESIINTFKIK